MTVGEKIKQRRLDLNLSQDELAKKVGYKSRSSINKIELSRDLPLKKVKKMAEALDISVSYLMGWEDENGNAPDLSDGIPMVIVEDDEEKKRKEYHDFFSSLTEEQLEQIKPATLILAYLSQLNEEGIARAFEDIENLTYNPRYKKDKKDET